MPNKEETGARNLPAENNKGITGITRKYTLAKITGRTTLLKKGTLLKIDPTTFFVAPLTALGDNIIGIAGRDVTAADLVLADITDYPVYVKNVKMPKDSLTIEGSAVTLNSVMTDKVKKLVDYLFIEYDINVN